MRRVQVGKWAQSLAAPKIPIFSPVTMLGPGMVKDESCWGEHAKCPRKGGDRRNNCHQSGSSGAAAGRTLSPESLDQLHLLLLDFATCFYSLLVDKVYY